jgi:hypothetical protein
LQFLKNLPMLLRSIQASPYRKWNLRRNPFGELTLQERAELAIVDELDTWLARLRDPRVALQLVGGAGFGKSTRLLALHRHMAGSTFVYYPEDGTRPELPSGRPLIVDEAQRMGWWNERKMLRGPGPIILATHVSMEQKLARAGWSLILVDLDQRLTTATLVRILNRRIEASRFDAAQSVPLIEETSAKMLLERYGDNVRSIEEYLYDLLQSSCIGNSPWPLVS